MPSVFVASVGSSKKTIVSVVSFSCKPFVTKARRQEADWGKRGRSNFDITLTDNAKLTQGTAEASNSSKFRPKKNRYIR